VTRFWNGVLLTIPARIDENKSICASVDQFSEKFVGIYVQGLRDIDEFHDIDPSFTRFDAGDLSLRGFQTACEFVLRELR